MITYEKNTPTLRHVLGLRILEDVLVCVFICLVASFCYVQNSSIYWHEIDTNVMVTAETLLPCDEHKEERISVYEDETYREDACEDFEDESAAGYTQLPMDSKVEILEGIPRMQWRSTLTKSISPRLRGILIVNGLNFLYGSNIAVVTETEFSLDPASFSVGRFVIAALVFTPFLKGAFKQPAVAKAGIELGVWASLAYLSQSVELMTTDAGRVSFFTTFSVLTVPLIAGLGGRKVPLLTWFAVFAALFGVGLLETSGAPPSVGDAWSLLSAVAFGVHLFRTEFHSRDLSSDVAFPIMALQMAEIAAISIMWSFASDLTSTETLLSSATLDWPELYHTLIGLPWVPLLYTGVLTTSLCLTLELMAMRDTSATEAAVINVLEPLWGAAFAWFALGERWGLRGWVGAAFILGGSLVTQIWGCPEKLP